MGRIVRPKASVLPKSALIPDKNLIQPPPNHFTHQVKSDQPYFYTVANQADAPDGMFPAGTKVTLLSRDSEGPLCHVVDGHGLHVATAFDGLRPIRARR